MTTAPAAVAFTSGRRRACSMILTASPPTAVGSTWLAA